MENNIEIPKMPKRIAEFPEDLQSKLRAVDSDTISFNQWCEDLTRVVREYNAAFGTNFDYEDAIYTYCLNKHEI